MDASINSVAPPETWYLVTRTGRGRIKKVAPPPNTTIDVATSTIPAEIWCLVIPFVTHSSDALDTSVRCPLDAKREDESALDAHRRENMADKLAVSLVSKQWRAIARQYLFETLAIKFEAPQYALPTGRLPRSFMGESCPFRHVKSLEIEYAYGEEEETTMRLFKPLLSISKLFPNLVILKVGFENCPLKLTDILFEMLVNAPSLRRLELTWVTLPSRFSHLLPSSAPRLEYLMLTNIQKHEPEPNPAVISLPFLHTLAMYGRICRQTSTLRWSLPSLVRLSLFHSTAEDDIIKNIEGALSLPLKTLGIPSWPRNMEPLQYVLNTYPQLEVLTLPFPDVRTWAAFDAYYPSLRYVGLYWGGMLSDDVYLLQVEPAIRAFGNRKMFPNVTYIRLRHMDWIPRVRKSGWWVGLMKECSDKGIVVDHIGH